MIDKKEFALLQNIAKGLAAHLGTKTEIVVHDYSKGFETSIVHIENGEISGRKVGQHGTLIGLEIIQGHKNEGGRFNYLTQTASGRQIHSSTIYIHSDEGELLGSLCINSDITDLLAAKNLIDQSVIPRMEKDQPVNISSEVGEILDSLINESIAHVGTPVSLMTREQKIKGIQYLQKKGAFVIKKAAPRIAKFYGISRYTIYNYLEENL